MARRLKYWFLMLDVFAPSYKFIIRDNETRFRSPFGAIFSIATIMLAFTYGFLRFVQWQDGTIQPNVAVYKYSLDKYTKISFSKVNLQIKIICEENNLPFINEIKEKLQIRIVSQNQSNYLDSKIENNEIIYSLNSEISKTHKLTYEEDIRKLLRIEVTFCKQIICTKEDNPEMIEFYVLQGLMLSFNYEFSTFNFKEQRLTTYRKAFETFLSFERIQQLYVTVSVQTSSIDYGYPFGVKNRNYEYLEDDQIFEASLDSLQSKFLRNQSGLLAIGTVSLTPIAQQSNIQYQNLFDIFILTVSLFKILISFGKLITFKQRGIMNSIIQYSIDKSDHSLETPLDQNIVNLFAIIQQMKVCLKLQQEKLDNLIKTQNSEEQFNYSISYFDNLISESDQPNKIDNHTDKYEDQNNIKYQDYQKNKKQLKEVEYIWNIKDFDQYDKIERSQFSNQID